MEILSIAVFFALFVASVNAQAQNLKFPGFLHSRAARIGFVVGMVLLGIVLIGLTFWLLVTFCTGPRAASHRKRRATQQQYAATRG
ncbi:hypothetical protein AURDEDRAFT_161561 [Auricularia subglabra TFB-10046 SS5]|nr:hypothetical protein AURDEDRAFT_161561 [Auricularia subglabra TFB-10046 SS5]